MKKLAIIILLIAGTVWWFKNPSIEASIANVSFEYIVKYSGEADTSASLPMLIALHGNGDTPDNFYETALDQLSIPARIILLKAPISMGRGSAWPHNNTNIQQYSDAIAEIIPLLQNNFPTKKQPALLGFSGGGAMAYHLTAAHPEHFSYIFPVSGNMKKQNLAGLPRKNNRRLKVFAFHGAQDSLVNISGGRMAYQLLQGRGANIHFKEFQGGHLGIFTNMKDEITQLVDEKLKSLLYGA